MQEFVSEIGIRQIYFVEIGFCFVWVLRVIKRTLIFSASIECLCYLWEDRANIELKRFFIISVLGIVKINVESTNKCMYRWHYFSYDFDECTLPKRSIVFTVFSIIFITLKIFNNQYTNVCKVLKHKSLCWWFS